MAINTLHEGTGHLNDRILIGIPTRGTVRFEWRAGLQQTMPTNWAHIEAAYLGFPLADAENLIAKACVEGGYEWLLMIEDDNVLPPGAFIRLNQWMIKKTHPIVGGLYFTKSVPPEPMIYREWGKGYFADWKMGQAVACRGLPFGCTLIHASIIKALWDQAPEYMVGETKTRKVFFQPDDMKVDAEGNYYMASGTTDLNFCNQIVKDKIFEKATWKGKHIWKDFQKKKYPFLVDTKIFVQHIDLDGVKWPLALPQKFLEGKATFKSTL